MMSEAIAFQSNAWSTGQTRDVGREPISCRSCRQKKIKCSRMRPSCQSCELHQCPCIYDAVPQKKGPNKEVLKGMLKRIDELEKKLAGNDKSVNDVAQSSSEQTTAQYELSSSSSLTALGPSTLPRLEPLYQRYVHNNILDVFFQNFHGNPYSFLHEATTRQQLAEGKLAPQLLDAIYAIGVRYLETKDSLYIARCEEFINLARQKLNVDEPSLPNIQTALLLAMCFFLLGLGKKCWMQLGLAIRMAHALDLQRELPAQAKVTPLDRELARRCFWACYIMDIVNVVGSKRPNSISNETIVLQLPCDEVSFQQGDPSPSSMFQHTNVQNASPFQSIGAMFVDITRILGRAIRYLQKGGVKGDSHFPWHPQSMLSEIRDELKIWASRISMLAMNSSPITDSRESPIYFLSQCMYHHIFVLIYRPFLPFSLSELEQNPGSMNKPWQTEVINLCLRHAIFIANLETTRTQTSRIRPLPYLSYCLTSAATIFIHSIHYADSADTDMKRLLVLLESLIHMRKLWRCVDSQCSTLRKVYICHTKLIKNFSKDGRYPSCVHLDDFFDRYADIDYDQGYVPFLSFDDWTSPIYDSPDDIFSSSSLLPILQALRGDDRGNTSLDRQMSFLHTPAPVNFSLGTPKFSRRPSSVSANDPANVEGDSETDSLASLLMGPLQDSADCDLLGNDHLSMDSNFGLGLFEEPPSTSDSLTQLLSDLANNNTDDGTWDNYGIPFATD